MTDRLRLALLGAGPVIERYHLPAIRAVPEVLPWIVADLDAGRRESIALRGSFRRSTDHYQDFIGQVDVAIVGLPNSLHATVSCELLKAGVHVLCEKPMARTVKECEDMLNAATAGGALLAIGHNRRYRSNVREAKYLLFKRMIGDIKHIVGEEGSRNDWPRSRAYFDPETAGGGTLLDIGIHTIDLIHYLVGDFEKVQFQGNQTSTTVESEAELQCTMTCGATCSLRFSRDRDLSNKLTFHGTEGTLTIGLWGPTIRLAIERGKAFRHFPELALSPVRRAMDSSFVDQLRSFVESIRCGCPPNANGEDGLRAVRVVEKAYRSTGAYLSRVVSREPVTSIESQGSPQRCTVSQS